MSPSSRVTLHLFFMTHLSTSATNYFGFSLGLLLPGACAGLPDGNCPGGKLALEGAIRSSNSSTSNWISSCIVMIHLPLVVGLLKLSRWISGPRRCIPGSGRLQGLGRSEVADRIDGSKRGLIEELAGVTSAGRNVRDDL